MVFAECGTRLSKRVRAVKEITNERGKQTYPQPNNGLKAQSLQRQKGKRPVRKKGKRKREWKPALCVGGNLSFGKARIPKDMRLFYNSERNILVELASNCGGFTPFTRFLELEDKCRDALGKKGGRSKMRTKRHKSRTTTAFPKFLVNAEHRTFRLGQVSASGTRCTRTEPKR